MEPEKGTTYSRWLRNSVSETDKNVRSTPLGWWYRHIAPPEAPADASLYQRERARRGRVASLSVTIFMLFLLAQLLQDIGDHNMVQVVLAIVGLAVSAVVLYLNRRGFVEIAGLFTFILLYIAGTSSLLNYPDGLSLSTLPNLFFSIIPEMLALAFFSANSILVVFFINVIQIWAIVVYGPHDATIAHLLQTAPLKIFLPLYLLQAITSITLYCWGRSAEDALKRADRAEEIVMYEQHEKEQHEQELEQKRQLDAGIQQILQTHIAVANGDLKVRAPLTQDHALWQVAVSLNTLIARLQRLSQNERELKLQQQKQGDARATGHHPTVSPSERELRLQQKKADKRTTGPHPAYRQERITDHRHPKYDPNQATNLKSNTTLYPRQG
jgi:hypothetical protein